MLMYDPALQSSLPPVRHGSDLRLVLASTSRYRRELLERLRLPFSPQAPDVDEAALPGELPAVLSERLAVAKAEAVASALVSAGMTDVLVIGSDQVADVDGRCIGKPGSHARAVEQLRSMSGRTVVFHTSVAVVRPSTDFVAWRRVPVTVRFRTLTERDIETYLHLEQPYDCAGSAKCETLGISLLAAIESDDPTALVGLPMIATCELLRQAGLDPLACLAESLASAQDAAMTAHPPSRDPLHE